MSEPLPVRYCHGCGQFDDHPRLTHIADQNRAELDKLYHYDCAPVEAILPEHAPALEATASGLRGQDVRDVMAAHAASIPEAPADEKQGV